MNLLENDTVCRSLSRSVARGDESMEDTPGLIRRVIKENMWQQRVLHETGEKIRFARFEDFIEAPPLEGLGTTLDIIKALCKRNPDVLSLIERATKRSLNGHGGNRSKITRNLETTAQKGNSREYIVALLERDGYDELAQAVLNREVSAAEARRRVGYKKKTIEVRLDDPSSAARTLTKHMDPDTMKELIALLKKASNK